MFLATTGLTEFWDTKDEILALGPWCTRHETRDRWNTFRIQYAPNPWDDRQRLHAAALYCDDLCDTLLEYLANRLNEIHSTNWSSHYWRVLLGHWLVRFVHSFHDRYIHIVDTARLYPNLRSWRLSAESYITPRDTLDFARLYTKDFLNLQLYSQILETAVVSIPTVARHFEGPSAQSPSSSERTKRMLNLLGKIAGRGGSRFVFCDISFDRAALFRLIKQLGFDATLMIEDSAIENRRWRMDAESRKSLVRKAHEDEFTSVLIQSLPQNLPQVFVEGYAETRKHALRRTKQWPRVVLSTTGWFFNESFKFLAAEAAENGARLLGWQHGGGYYLWRRGPQPMELKTVDKWFAWGKPSWLPGAGTLPSPHLHQLDRSDYWSYAGGRDGIVLVANEHSMYPYWLLSIPLGTQYEEYIDWRIRFVSALSPSLKGHITVRLYPEDYGWAQAIKMRTCLPDVRFDDNSVSFINRLKRVKLAVFDHPTTSFIEGLAFNVPTILYWNFEHWEPSAGAIPCLRQLQDAGILHDKPELAAAQAGSVYEHSEGWWRSAQVQAARRRFMNEFANADSEWLDQWQSRLNEESQAGAVQ